MQLVPVFEFIELPKMSFEESVRAFETAEAVVSPHSAGLANIIFCQPGTHVIYWTWEGESVDNWYENIAFVAGAKLQKIEVAKSSGQVDPREEDYTLNPEKIRHALGKLDGYLKKSKL